MRVDGGHDLNLCGGWYGRRGCWCNFVWKDTQTREGEEEDVLTTLLLLPFSILSVYVAAAVERRQD